MTAAGAEAVAPTRREVIVRLGVGVAAWAGLCGCAQPGAGRGAADRQLFRGIGLAGADSRAALAKEVGFDFLTPGVRPTLVPEQGEAEFASRLAHLRALPLPIKACNVFLPSTLRVTGPAADQDAVIAYAAKVFARAARAGVDRIVFGSAAARSLPVGFGVAEARAQFVAVLRRMAPLAQAAGVVVMPENLNRGECNFLNRVSELTTIVAEVDHPAIRINADLYHMAVEAEPAAALSAAVPFLHQLEIAEAARRTIPGIAGDDFRPYFRVLLRAGWSGWLNVEAAPATAAEYRNMFTVLAAQVRDAAATA